MTRLGAAATTHSTASPLSLTILTNSFLTPSLYRSLSFSLALLVLSLSLVWCELHKENKEGKLQRKKIKEVFL
jgi:hypothetical protein